MTREVNGYTHLALSSLYAMTKGRPQEQVRKIADAMQTVLDMDKAVWEMEKKKGEEE